MSSARGLLPTAIALAAIALTAATASAQETEVEVWDEHANEACGFTATGGGCQVHIVGEGHLTALPSGVRVSECHDELEGVIQTDGTGEVEWNGATEPDAFVGCNVINCANQLPDEDDWELLNVGELGGELEHINLRMCLEGSIGGGDLHCNLEIDFVGSEEQVHDYAISTVQLCANGARRAEVSWTIESEDVHDEIELIHHVEP